MKKRFVAILCCVLTLFGGVFFVGCGDASDYLKYELLVDGTYSVGLKEEYLENFTVEVNEDFVVPSIKQKSVGTGRKYKEVPRHIELPDSYNGKLVTKIADGGFANGNIESVTLSAYTSCIGVAAFYGAELTEISLPDTVVSVGEFAFLANNLSALKIPDGAMNVGRYAFAKNENLYSVNLGRGLLYIDKGVFCGCDNLTSIVVPSNIRSIKEFAFSYADEPKSGSSIELKTILFKGDEKEWIRVSVPDVIATRVEAVYYAENGDIAKYIDELQSVRRVWTYNDKPEAEVVDLVYDDTVDGKTYAFSHSEVNVTDGDWDTLGIYDKSDRLRELLSKDEIELFKRSNGKDEYIALREAYDLNEYADETVVFENERVGIRRGDTPALRLFDYKVVNGKIYIKIDEEYFLKYIIEDGGFIEECGYIFNGSEKFYYR